MFIDKKMNFGEQPLAKIMFENELTPKTLLNFSTEQITYKMVSRACKGRRLSKKIKYKIRTALNNALEKEYALTDLFNY